MSDSSSVSEPACEQPGLDNVQSILRSSLTQQKKLEAASRLPKGELKSALRDSTKRLKEQTKVARAAIDHAKESAVEYEAAEHDVRNNTAGMQQTQDKEIAKQEEEFAILRAQLRAKHKDEQTKLTQSSLRKLLQPFDKVQNASLELESAYGEANTLAREVSLAHGGLSIQMERAKGHSEAEALQTLLSDAFRAKQAKDAEHDKLSQDYGILANKETKTLEQEVATKGKAVEELEIKQKRILDDGASQVERMQAEIDLAKAKEGFSKVVHSLSSVKQRMFTQVRVKLANITNATQLK